MKHSHRVVQELLSAGELTGEERRTVDEHLKTCPECRRVSEESADLVAALRKRKTISISERELQELRRELMASVRRTHAVPSALDRMQEWLAWPAPFPVRVTVAGIVPLILGIVIGYAVLTPRSDQAALPLQPAVAVAQYEQGTTEIADVRFLDADQEAGTVEFTFQAVRPVRVRGSIHDEEVQRILARALLKEENPGVRIRTVSALAATAEESLDPRTKTALLTTMTSDPNPGVRKEAMKALQKVPMDSEIRDALIRVLVADKNEGMRIDAINSLTALEPQHPALGEELITVLQRRVKTDNNTYIRLRAEAMLKEVQQ